MCGEIFGRASGDARLGQYCGLTRRGKFSAGPPANPVEGKVEIGLQLGVVSSVTLTGRPIGHRNGAPVCETRSLVVSLEVRSVKCS